MASIKFGAIVTDMRGKLGGHVFQKGNQSRVLKTNARPRVSPSSFKASAQITVNSVVNSYSSLSLALKSEWAAAADTFFKKNRFGDSQVYTGRQLFLMLNNNLLRAGFSSITDPSGLSRSVPNPVLTSVVIATGSSTINFTGASSQAGYRYALYMQKISANRLTPSEGGFISSGSLINTNSNDAGSYARLVQRYGTPVAGQSFYFRVYKTNVYGFRAYPITVKATIS